jgi:phosphatidylserine/phosphatidylglycerophosphate/cardiolipin synthase-like enzyme
VAAPTTSIQPQSGSGPRWVVIVGLLLVGLLAGFGFGLAASSRVQSSLTRTVTIQATRIQTVTSFSQQAVSADLVEYCFSSPQPPHGDCASRLVYWFGQANISIHVMIYSFTLDNVGDALVKAKQRGVDVKIAWDKTEVNVQGSEYQKLKNAGIDIRIDRETGIALLHDKVAIIDSRIIITGSFNWSANANLNNRENLVVINSTTWAAAYERNFQQVWNASTLS